MNADRDITALDRVNCVLLFGYGRGYTVQRILQAYPWMRVILVDLPLELREISARATKEKDIQQMARLDCLLDPRVYTVNTKYAPDMDIQLHDQITINICAPIKVVANYPQEQATMYAPVIQHISKHMDEVTLMSNTYVTQGRIYIENMLRNLKRCIITPGIIGLKDAFKGIPAYVVSAGPSLSKNIAQLKRVGRTGIIIAVGPSLRPLLAAGIKPHLCVLIDSLKDNMAHLDGIWEQTKDVTLLFDPMVYPDVVNKWQGPRLTMSVSNCVGQWFTQHYGSKGEVTRSGTVSVSAMNAGVYMGCNPIYLVGQDLSYPGGKSHADGVDEQRGIEITRDEVAGEDVFTHSGQIVYYVDGLDGSKLPTNVQMLAYKTIFENLAGRYNAQGIRIVNCTEGGALIKNMENERLERVVGINTLSHDFAGVLAYLRESSGVIRWSEQRKPIERLVSQVRSILCMVDSAESAVRELMGSFERGTLTWERECELKERIVGKMNDMNADPVVMRMVTECVHAGMMLARSKEADMQRCKDPIEQMVSNMEWREFVLCMVKQGAKAVKNAITID